MAEARRILIDTGIIVAVLDRREQQHLVAQQQFRELPKPFFTCESVISEACFLLRGSSVAKQKVIELVACEAVKIEFSLSEEIDHVRALMKKYEDVPMSFADACLVRMSEISSGSSVLTFDSDFKVYRKHRNRAIPLVLSDGKTGRNNV